MKKVLLALSFLVAVGLQVVLAQTKTITGKVTDNQNGEPMPGVSVVVRGTTIGTITMIDGTYSLSVPSDATNLLFSFVGMTTQDVLIEGRSVIDIKLHSDSEDLDEVVVVGYGTRSKKNLISSVTKVDAEEMRKVSIASIDGALQGNAVGLVVNQNSGAPGQGMSVRIRGASTISGSNQPLYVIDGVPVITGNTVSTTYGGQGANALTNLSSTDIESIEVLKDASASAIYGSQASNGVILITTKRGKAGKARVDVNFSYASQNAINRYEVMNTGEYYKFADIAFANGGFPYSSYWSYANGWVDSPTLAADDPQMVELYSSDFGDNYIDHLYVEDAPLVESSVSVSGGDEKTKYYVGFSSFDQDGVIKGQGYNRRSVRGNFDRKLFNWATLTFNLSGSDEEVNRINGDNNIFAPLTTGVLEQPGWKLFNENGTYNISDFTFSNPLQNAVELDGVSNSFRLIGNVGLRLNFENGFGANLSWGIDRLDVRERRYSPSDSKQGLGSNGSATLRVNNYTRYITSNNLTYNKTLGDITMDLLAGMEYQQFTSTYSTAASNNFASTSLRWPSSGAEAITTEGYQTENKLASLIGRASFSIKDKYLLEGSIRADASSKFGDENKVGYFPAVSAGWKVHNENFFDVNAISEFKVKAGYGVTGNATAIGNFAARTLASSAAYASSAGIAVSQLGDSNLSWESTGQLNVGFDLGLMKDRITLEYQYFQKKTTDLLLAFPLPPTSGFTSILRNIGEMENKGHEISLTGRVFQGDFSWDITLNVGTLKNEVTKIYRGPDGTSTPIDYGFASRVAVGQSLGAFFVFKSLGLDENGDVIYDTGDDDNLTDDDKYFAGKPFPDFSGNLLNTFSYKGFDLSFNFQFSQGFELYHQTMAFGGGSGAVFYNKFKSQVNYWTPDNTNTDIPRPFYGAQQSANNRDSDRFIEDGSYIRFKNITFGYSLPENLIPYAKVRVYVGADNIKTWTDYSGLDPEVNAFGSSNVATGSDFFTQGLNKMWKAGINVTF